MVSGIDEKTAQPANLERIPKKVLDKQDFINLFITQLQFQDPMKPIENNEMAMQLALFNQVDQLFKINETLNKIKENFADYKLTFATGLIGKLIKVQGNIGKVENGKFLGGEFVLDKPANKVEIIIRNSENKLVKKIELTNLTKGTHKIEWDATDENGNIVPDGNYKISIIVPSGEENQSIPPIMYTKVTGVVIGEDGINLKVGDSKEIEIDNIKEILGS